MLVESIGSNSLVAMWASDLGYTFRTEMPLVSSRVPIVGQPFPAVFAWLEIW